MKPAVGGETAASVSEKKKKNKSKVPTLEEYLQQRDYLGALTLLEVPPPPPHLSIYLSVCPYKSDLLKIMFINHALQYSYDFFLITVLLFCIVPEKYRRARGARRPLDWLLCLSFGGLQESYGGTFTQSYLYMML